MYGPRGRPDMAPYIFIKKISQGGEVTQFGDGTSWRDYTYVGDVVQGVSARVRKITLAAWCVVHIPCGTMHVMHGAWCAVYCPYHRMHIP